MLASGRCVTCMKERHDACGEIKTHALSSHTMLCSVKNSNFKGNESNPARNLHKNDKDPRSQQLTFDEARHQSLLQLMPLLVFLLCAKILDESTKDCFIFEC